LENTGESEERTRFDLFGGPALSSRTHSYDLTLHQQAFLTLVFAHGRAGISRPRLGWMIWGEDDSPRVRQRIRQLLHRTHERTGITLVLADADVLRPASGVVDCDLDRFEGLLRRGSLAEAAGLLAHGFASRLVRCPNDEFEEWLDAKRVTLLEELRRAAARRWDETSEAGLWGEARDAAEALYMHFPLDPKTVERVIESRVRTGSLASAEAVFGQFRDSRGGEPVPKEILALLERISRLHAAPTTPIAVAEDRAPLVGRRAEVAQARRTLDEVRQGLFRFVLITGEGGIGKTRVMEELQRAAVIEGLRCLHARPAQPEQHIPLNPLADALRSIDLAGHLRALGAPWRSIIASLLPVEDDEPMEDIPPIQEARLSRRLMDALYMLIERVATEEPTVLFLDDLQWADATTVTALQFIQRRWEGGPFGIVAAARPDLLERSEPGSRYLSRLGDLPVTRIDLKELSAKEGHHLVVHLMGDDVEPHVADRLCELAGLHPLYLTELTKDLAAGRLKLPQLPVDEVAIPVSLKEIFTSRVRLLSSMAIKVAGLLAVRAKPMRITDIAELTGIPLDHCADCAEELKTLRLVESRTDSLHITHELFRSALYQHLSETRRAVLHRAIAGHLASRPDDVLIGELAMHHARAGDREAAARTAWSAATKAVENGAIAEAAYFFELVVENEDDAPQRAEATAELARALHLNRAIGRANPLLEVASMRLREVGNHARALRIEIMLAEGLAEAGSTPVRDLLSRLGAIKEQAQQLGDWEALALALDAELHLRHSVGDLPGIEQLFGELRRVIRVGPRLAAAIAHSGMALGVLLGDHEEALHSARRAVQDCDPSSDHRLRLLLRLLLVLQYRGLFYSDEVRPIVAEARTLAKKSGDLLLRFSLESNLAVAYLDAGDLEAAEVLMLSSSKMLGSAELDLNRFNQANNSGELALAQGEFSRSREWFQLASEYIGPRTPVYALNIVNSGLGLCALATGNLAEARSREERLTPMQPPWYVDPTTIVAFQSRMHEVRQEYAEAQQVLQDAADDIEDRLVLAWLKIRQLQVRLERRLDPAKAATLAREGLNRSQELGLRHRAIEFERLLVRLGAAPTN
jgi:tetratricopeptide (TPR) repeat protein